MPESLIPVSYTHLDVYKRQDEEQGVVGRSPFGAGMDHPGRILEIVEFFLIELVVPVSYTHLDVYKRQAEAFKRPFYTLS